jgi:DNA invertase Pin-like site-specific DNA recombinase
MKKTLHIYTRVSTRIQEKEGTSLEMQKREGEKKAKELGMKSKLWREGSASSHHEDFKNRPVLKQLLVEVEDGSVGDLFVFNNDRLSRNEIDQQTIKIALQRNDVVLYTKDGKFDLSNPQDKFIKTLMDGVASYDNALRAERSRLGKIARVRQGFWYGGPPAYGYQIIDKRLSVHPEESKWVKKMFKWYYDGKTIMWIKSQLDKSGVLARRGNLFSTGSINVLLRNTHHIGYYTWSDKKSGETITCECPSIVDETIWNAIDVKRKKEFARVKQNNTTRNFYLLRDLMVCGECGSNMSGRIIRSHREQNYYCPKKTRDWKKGALPEDTKWKRGKVGEHGCSMNRSVNIPNADENVWDLVMDVVSNSSILKQGFKKEVLQSKFKGDEETARLLKNERIKSSRLKKELKLVQSSIADVETDNLLKKYDDVVYQQIKKNLVAEMKTKTNALEQSRIKSKELGNHQSWLDWIDKYGDDLTLTSNLPKEDRKEYLHGLLDRIEVRLDKKTLDHELQVFFRLGLVGDGIEYVNPKRKSDGYKVVEGKKKTSVVITSGRRTQKKSDEVCPPPKTIDYCGIESFGGKKPHRITLKTGSFESIKS